MKNFLKLFVSIIVVIAIAGTLYLVLRENANYQEEHPELGTSGEQLSGNPMESGEKNDDTSGEVMIPSGEVVAPSGEEVTPSSGDEAQTVEEKVEAINRVEMKNRLATVTNTEEAMVGVEVVGSQNQDYFTSFDTDKMGVTVQVAGTMAYILPAPDFVNNAQYHYDEDGNLVLYICELTGVGGEVRYYFENGALLTTLENVEEGVTITQENSDEILTRAKLIYETYMK